MGRFGGDRAQERRRAVAPLRTLALGLLDRRLDHHPDGTLAVAGPARARRLLRRWARHRLPRHRLPRHRLPRHRPPRHRLPRHRLPRHRRCVRGGCGLTERGRLHGGALGRDRRRGGRGHPRPRAARPHRVADNLHAHARPANPELNLVARRERMTGDALATHVRSVTAPDVNQHPGGAFAPDLRVPPRGVEVGMGIERHLVVGQATEADHLAVELDHPPGVRTEGLVEADHARRSPTRRAADARPRRTSRADPAPSRRVQPPIGTTTLQRAQKGLSGSGAAPPLPPPRGRRWRGGRVR